MRIFSCDARNDASPREPEQGRESSEHAIANGTERDERATSISHLFPSPASSPVYYKRRYISSRRKKFNVAVKADGNADCRVWASPVTALHRTVHISRMLHPSTSPSAAFRRRVCRIIAARRHRRRRLAAIGRSLAATSLSIPRISNRLTL